jgi:hypothetical protein
VGRESFQVLRVGRDDGPPGLGTRHNYRIDSRAASRKASQQSSSAGEGFRDDFRDLANLQQSVHVRVSAGVSLKAFNKDDGRYARRPEGVLTKRNDQCQRIPGVLRQSADAAGIQDQHEALACLTLGATRYDSLRERGRFRSLSSRRPTDALRERSSVLLAPRHELSSAKLGPDRLLK